MVRFCVLVASLAFCSAGAYLLNSKLPPRDLVDRLETQVQRRFQDVSKGLRGISRLGEPYETHRPAYGYKPWQPENEDEKRIQKDLSGWDVVALTASKPKPLLGRNGQPSKGTVYVRVNGPVSVAGLTQKDFQAGAYYPPIQEEAQKALQTGADGYEFDYKDWHFVTRKVAATETCVSCHSSRDGHKVKVGDSIGIYLLGFRRQSKP